MSQMRMQFANESPFSPVVVAEPARTLAPSARYRYPTSVTAGLLTPLASSGSPSSLTGGRLRELRGRLPLRGGRTTTSSKWRFLMRLLLIPYRLIKVMLQFAAVVIFAVMIVFPFYAFTMETFHGMKRAHAAAMHLHQQQVQPDTHKQAATRP